MRKFLGYITILLLVFSFGVSDVYAQEKEYKTVDEILEGTPFIPVNRYNFEREKAEGNVVLFFYENIDVETFNGRLAKVMKEVSKNFPDVNFLSYKAYSDGLTGSDYLQKFGFSGTPYFAFYINGNRVFKNDGGPNKGFTEIWIPEITELINQHFNL